MHSKSTLRFACLVALAGSAYADSAIASLVAELKTAPTANDRLALLSDEQLVFNFLSPPSGVVTGAGGHTVEASSENFAAVVGNGVAMTIGFLGPCAINTPHTHPRATEINFSVNGTLRAGLLTENGARFVVSDLPPGSASVFPKGAIHFEMNTGCEPAQFVAAFNDEDPGVLSVAQRYFGLPPDIIGASLGGLGVVEVGGLEALIPDNVALGTDECLARCGLTRTSQPTLQHQPVVSGNANPSSAAIKAPTVAAAPTSSSTSSSSTSSSSSLTSSAATSPAAKATATATAGSGSKDLSNLSAAGAASNSDSASGTSPVMIALVVINGVLVLGILAAAFMYVRGRSHRSVLDSHQYAPTAVRELNLKAGSERYDPATPRDGAYYDPYTSAPPSASTPHFKDEE
ncbi:hypothetical protein HWV62_26276 [Athelia sp. TMB]|nr:hypothetical protein HWV62_26276 [Athelia sp. TMB]